MKNDCLYGVHCFVLGVVVKLACMCICGMPREVSCTSGLLFNNFVTRDPSNHKAFGFSTLGWLALQLSIPKSVAPIVANGSQF